MDQIRIGAFLKDLRKEKELTQEQLAEKLNVSGRTISRWETGSNMPDIGMLVELAAFFDVSIPEIISGERKSMETSEETKETAVALAEYSSNKVKIGKQKVIGILTSGFGVFIMISALMLFPSESSWGSIYSVLGGICLVIGIFFMIRSVVVKRLCRVLIILGCIVLLFGAFTVSDYLAVSQFHQVPRFRYETIYDSGTPHQVVYKTLFYTVIRENPGTTDEQIYIRKKNEFRSSFRTAAKKLAAACYFSFRNKDFSELRYYESVTLKNPIRLDGILQFHFPRLFDFVQQRNDLFLRLVCLRNGVHHKHMVHFCPLAVIQRNAQRGTAVPERPDGRDNRLIGTGIKRDRREVCEIAEDGADPVIVDIGFTCPVFGRHLQIVALQRGIQLVERFRKGLIHGGVQPRRQQNHAPRLGEFEYLQVLTKRERQPAAGGIAHEDDVFRLRFFEQTAIQLFQKLKCPLKSAARRPAVQWKQNFVIRVCGNPVAEDKVQDARRLAIGAAMQIDELFAAALVHGDDLHAVHHLFFRL